MRAILIAAHPYAVPGELLGLALVLTTAGLWTWVLQRRQMAAATTATTE